MVMKIEVLELKPVKNKKVRVYLMKYQEELNRNQFLEELLESYKFNFISIDRELDVRGRQSLMKYLIKYGLVSFIVGVPEYAKGYLLDEISKQKKQVEELEAELEAVEEDSFKKQNLKSWIEYMKSEVEEKKRLLNLKIRPEWIAKKILDLIRLFENPHLRILHFTPGNILPQVKKILEELDIPVEVLLLNEPFIGPTLISGHLIQREAF